MNTSVLMRFVLVCVALSIIVTATAQQGQSPSTPAPAVKVIKTEVHCGESAGSMEPYDMNITVLQVVRGNDAWERLKAASAANNPAKAGFEYIVAHVSIEMKPRVAPANKTFDLGRPMQFIALSEDGREYETPSVTPPKPELSRPLHANESADGWVVFLVAQKESKPVMIFDPSSGGAMGRGKAVFFSLY